MTGVLALMRVEEELRPLLLEGDSQSIGSAVMGWVAVSYTHLDVYKRQGQGLALGRRPLIDELLLRRALVAPLRDEIATERGYFLAVEQGASKRPAVQALAAWLIEQARLSGAGSSLR